MCRRQFAHLVQSVESSARCIRSSDHSDPSFEVGTRPLLSTPLQSLEKTSRARDSFHGVPRASVAEAIVLRVDSDCQKSGAVLCQRFARSTRHGSSSAASTVRGERSPMPGWGPTESGVEPRQKCVWTPSRLTPQSARRSNLATCLRPASTHVRGATLRRADSCCARAGVECRRSS